MKPNKKNQPVEQTQVEERKEAKAETPNGKKIQAKQDKFGNWFLCFETGGELPEILKGKFCDMYAVDRVISSYLSSK
jgi:hypothetical protein